MNGPQGTLHIDDGGQGGLPIVFLHAGAGNSSQWSYQLDHLRRSRRALAIDLRGHGGSALPRNGDFRIEALAEDVGAVVDALGLERFVLAGHSLGGAVAVAYAGAHPRRVAGLFLLDASSDGRVVPRELAGPMMRALASDAYAQTIHAYWAPMLEGARPEVAARVRADLDRTPPAAVAGPLSAILDFDPVTPLKRFGGPAFALITRLNETPHALHQLVPGIPHERVDGVSHWLQLDAPERVNAALEAFLAKVEQAR